MFSFSLYLAFVQLRKQLYKCKRSVSCNRYSEIEQYRSVFRTFWRFYDEARENFSLYRIDDQSIQDVFDQMLDLSQRNKLKWFIDKS